MSKETAMAMITGTPTTQAQGVPPVTPQETAPDPGTTDPRIQALIKKEVALVKERENLSKAKQEWEPKLKEAEQILAKAKQFEDTLKTDKIAALKLLGYSDTDIFNLMAQASEKPAPKTPEEIAREEAQRILKERDESDEKKRVEEMKKADDRAVNTSISTLVAAEANKEKYDYINFHGDAGQELVKETLFQFAAQLQGKEIDQTTAEMLLVEAADAVEAYFEKQDIEMEKLEKRKKRLAPKEEPPKDAAAPVQEVKKEEPVKSKTITSRVVPTSAAVAGKRETSAERRARWELSLKTGDASLIKG